MVKDISLSLVFPAYNEAPNLKKLVKEAILAVEKISQDFEIILVNDGSKDNSEAVIKKIASEDQRIRLVNHEVNKGYGQTVWDGLRAAKKDWVFFSDADLQFDLKEIEKLIKHVPKYKVVVGYRENRKDPWIRKINASSWTFMNKFLFGLKIRDLDCAFKLFHRQAIKDLDIKSGGATFTLELMARLKKNGYEFVEVGVSHRSRQKGQQTGANLKVIFRAFREMMSLYRRSDLGNIVVKDMIKFGLTGAVSTVLDVGTLNLFFIVVHTSLYLSTFMGFIAGTINGYLMNNFWTYRRLGKKANPKDFIKLAMVGAVGLGLTELIMFILSGKVGLNYNVAKLIAIVIVFFWNFFAARRWAFGAHKHTENG